MAIVQPCKRRRATPEARPAEKGDGGWHSHTCNGKKQKQKKEGTMKKLKDEMWMVAKEYARLTGEVIEGQPDFWVAEDIAVDSCCFGDCWFLNLEEMQVIVDHLDRWVEKYGSKEKVGEAVVEWLDWGLEDANNRSVHGGKMYARINLWSWLKGLRPDEPCVKEAMEREQLDEGIDVLKRLIEEYREERSLGNVLKNLEGRRKEMGEWE